MRVARCEMRDARCEMRVASCEMRDARCEMRVAGLKSRGCAAYRDVLCALGEEECSVWQYFT